MLRVQETGVDRLGEEYLIRDAERSISFVFVGSLAMGAIQVFRLTVCDLEVPVSAFKRESDDGALVYANVSVGGSFPIEATYGIAGRGYLSSAEEAAMLSIAAECLLVYGSYYNGLTTRRDTTRVELPNGPRSLADFGY
jgi:hypothetical protein